MTPRNPKELRQWMRENILVEDDDTFDELYDALDSAGLAIVPLEPTEAMVEAGNISGRAAPPNEAKWLMSASAAYTAMVEASPFRRKE